MDTLTPKPAKVSVHTGIRLRPFLIPAVKPTELARTAGCSRQFVYDVLNGRRRPSARILDAARELGIPVDLLLGDGQATNKDSP